MTKTMKWVITGTYAFAVVVSFMLGFLLRDIAQDSVVCSDSSEAPADCIRAPSRWTITSDESVVLRRVGEIGNPPPSPIKGCELINDVMMCGPLVGLREWELPGPRSITNQVMPERLPPNCEVSSTTGYIVCS